jgi:uncharacterized protein
MFERVLPEGIKPQKLARQGTTLAGVIPAERLVNLLEGSLGAGRPAEVELRFSPGDGVIALVEGRAKAEVVWQCQRCLEPVAVCLDVPVKLALVGDVAVEEGLPDGFEPLPLADEEMPLADLVEQELILAAPIVPQHEDCSSPETVEAPIEEPVDQVDAKKKSPFMDLAALLKGGDPQQS